MAMISLALSPTVLFIIITQLTVNGSNIPRRSNPIFVTFGRPQRLTGHRGVDGGNSTIIEVARNEISSPIVDGVIDSPSSPDPKPTKPTSLIRLQERSDEYIDFDWTLTGFGPWFDHIGLNTSLPSNQLRSPKFYVQEPGYRMELLLLPNSTFEGGSYLGILFRLVSGIYDSDLIWPFKWQTILTLVDPEENETKAIDTSYTVTPNADPCRLRSLFLRPSHETDKEPIPDGCGNRRHLPLTKIKNYLNKNQDLVIRLRIRMQEEGKLPDVAKMSLDGNSLTSDYVWTLNEVDKKEMKALKSGQVEVSSSPPFYTHPRGYLIQMFLTLLPKKKAFALSVALVQGDFDRHLRWPFPYDFQVSIVDQSPGYWRRDYSIRVHSSNAECGTGPFEAPGPSAKFCFLTIQSLQLLQLSHYNFIRNGSVQIRFQTQFQQLSETKMASIKLINTPDGKSRLVSEYSWLLPDMENKLARFDFSSNKVKVFQSPPFFSNGQGYLMQLVLTLNSSLHNESHLGLSLKIIEGQFDSVLDWPFNKTFELMVINQHYRESNDIVTYIIPDQELKCGHSGSFVKPIKHNPPCGRDNFISFSRISRSNGFIRLGNLLVKARIYL